MDFFNSQTELVTLMGYQLSYLEFTATLSGLICVWLASRQNLLTWPIGVINLICLFILFYQVQLYADMLLQIYFFIVAIYGWYTWKYHKANEKPVAVLSGMAKLKNMTLILLISISTGYFLTDIHLKLPHFFPQPTSFPYFDSFIAIGSIFANILMARRVLENWLLWILIDVVAVYVYLQKGILFIAILYGVYCLIAWSGYVSWKKQKLIT